MDEADRARSVHYTATQELFRWVAIHRSGFYDASPGGPLRHTLWQRWVRRTVRSLLNELLDRTTTIRTLMDVGCGRGDFVLQLAACYPQLAEVWGTDFAPEMLLVAGQAAGKRSSRTFFQEADLLAMSFESERFDVVLCINVLHHILDDDQDKALQELARITRRYLILEIKNHSNPYYRRITTRHVRPWGSIRVFPTTVPRVDRVMTRCGLQRRAVRGIFPGRWLSPLLVLLYEKV